MSSRNRIRIAVALLMPPVALAGTAPAQVTSIKQDGARGTPGPKEVVLDLTPAAAPTPTFRHRIWPTTPQLNPGDAAPIYLRLGYELQDGALREADDKAAAWLALPSDEFPVTDARALADRWAPQLKQIEYGARRRTCDWNYTVPEERDHAFMIRLPDAQAMRIWGRLLAVKARAEIAEGKVEDAIRTVETGLAFGRHVGEGPFFINVLIGISIANPMLDRVDELIGRPDAPNLYWALTALPRPLIGMRQAAENERGSIEGMVPEVAEGDRPRSDAGWSALVARLHAGMLKLEKIAWPEGKPESYMNNSLLKEDLGAYRVAILPKARAYLKERGIEARSDDQAIALAIIGSYREVFDDYFKRAYLPHPDAAPLGPKVDERVIAGKAGPAAVFLALLPAVQAVQMAEARLDRKVAALRVVEALRMYAAAHDGGLPETLDQIKEVPVPGDPLTGKPFEYRREGESAVLTSRWWSPVFWLVYRITVRK